MLDNYEYSHPSKISIQKYSGDDHTIGLTIQVDLITIKFKDGIRMYKQDYYDIVI